MRKIRVKIGSNLEKPFNNPLNPRKSLGWLAEVKLLPLSPTLLSPGLKSSSSRYPIAESTVKKKMPRTAGTLCLPRFGKK